MARQYTSKDCPLYETEYCERLNMPSCNACPAFGRDSAAAVREDLDAIERLLPANGISELFHAEHCVLCREAPKPRTCFALEDLGNPEPAREGRNFLGMKVKLRTGSILPIQMSCCAACRRKHRILAYFPTLLPLVAAVVMLLVLANATVRERLANVHSALPLGLFLLVVAAAALGGKLGADALRRRYEKETYLNVMEHPLLAQMAERGWFELQRGRHMSHLIFSKGPRKQGLYTK